MRISDWSSDVCSSDLLVERRRLPRPGLVALEDRNFVGAPLLQLVGAAARLRRDHAERPAARSFARLLAHDMADAIGQRPGPQRLDRHLQTDTARVALLEFDVPARAPGRSEERRGGKTC